MIFLKWTLENFSRVMHTKSNQIVGTNFGFSFYLSTRKENEKKKNKKKNEETHTIYERMILLAVCQL